MSFRPVALAALVAAALPVQAAVPIADASSVYTQNFDSLTAGTGSTAWSNDATLAGWSLFTAGGIPMASYVGGTGSSTTGSFYSFGSSGSGERALGGLGSGGTYFGSPSSGAVAGYVALALTNASSAAFDSVTVAFDGEQWRNGGNTSAQTMKLEYGFGATFAGVAGWNAAGTAFDWASPVVGSSAAAMNGNDAGRVGGVGGTVALSWAAGDTLWLRWVEVNDVGNDHGLAIDDLSVSVTSAVPEPGAGALLAAGLAALGAVARRRRA
jgi:hypothetical protein